MSDTPLSASDYPLAETRPERLRTATGKHLQDITLEAVLNGSITPQDLAITPETLNLQAQIARAAGRDALAANFARAAEMATLPQELVFRLYELLRPGRAKNRAEMESAAQDLRQQFGAHALAAFMEDAAEVYERRKLFGFRF